MKESKNQALRYYEGKPEAGKNDPFFPSQAEGPNTLGEVIDTTRKPSWGKGSLAEKTGKLGDLDPQETDQPSWVGTWSPLQEGPNGAGPVRDENYPVQRPRTQTRQEERFRYANPEFQEGIGDGDWTSAKWTKDV